MLVVHIRRNHLANLKPDEILNVTNVHVFLNLLFVYLFVCFHSIRFIPHSVVNFFYSNLFLQQKVCDEVFIRKQRSLLKIGTLQTR